MPLCFNWTNTRQIEDTDNGSSLYHQPSSFCLFGWLILLWHLSLCSPKPKTASFIHEEVCVKSGRTLQRRETKPQALFAGAAPRFSTRCCSNSSVHRRSWLSRNVTKTAVDETDTKSGDGQGVQRQSNSTSLPLSVTLYWREWHDRRETTGGQWPHIRWSVAEFQRRYPVRYLLEIHHVGGVHMYISLMSFQWIRGLFWTKPIQKKWSFSSYQAYWFVHGSPAFFHILLLFYNPR